MLLVTSSSTRARGSERFEFLFTTDAGALFSPFALAERRSRGPAAAQFLGGKLDDATVVCALVLPDALAFDLYAPDMLAEHGVTPRAR
jgi:hypothetical protein